MRKKLPFRPSLVVLVALGTMMAGTRTTVQADSPDPRVTFAQDDDAGALTVQIDGQEAFVYQYGDEGRYREKLVWVRAHEIPVLDEQRDVRIVPLGNGEYLLDMVFTLTASYGDVDFVSDAVHYAWPYLRINEKFHGDNGGTITNDRGQTGQAETNMEPAKWVDYSNTVDGTTEGVAVFQWPDGQTRRWLTREYGTFGPRRPDAQSGRPFTIPRDGTLSQRVGILVHRGDVETGRVGERYEAYIGW